MIVALPGLFSYLFFHTYGEIQHDMEIEDVCIIMCIMYKIRLIIGPD